MTTIRVVKGNPTPEEVAALVAVLTTRMTTHAHAAGPQRASNWATYWRNARTPFRPGPGQWRASAHP